MRTRVWIAILNAERNNRYFEALSSRYRLFRFFTNLGISLGSLGAAASLLGQLDLWVTVVLFVVTAACTSWSMLADYSRKVVLCDIAHRRCAELGIMARDLWFKSDFDDIQTISRLEIELNEAQAVDIGADFRLNRRCAEQAYQWAKNEFFLENTDRTDQDTERSSTAAELTASASSATTA